MARVKGAVTTRKRHKKVLKLAKGYYGAKHKVYRRAKEAVMRALKRSYIDRRRKKRDFRSLWITRINAATRMNDMSYSRFMSGLKGLGIALNRKVLAEMAVNNQPEFSQLVEKVRVYNSKSE